jgi:hypothetical protein
VITPNKAIALEGSALGLSGIILAHGPGPQDLVSLFKVVAPRFESADDFILTVDVLYVLGRIDVNLLTRMVTYAR